MTRRRIIPLLFCLLFLVALPLSAFATPPTTEDRPFLDICENGTPQEIEWALANGASVYDRDEENFTPLMAASISNTLEAVVVLLNAGAEVNTSDIMGLTPLIYAAGNNPDAYVCQALIAAGANVNQPDDEGYTPLMYAAINNKNPRVLEALIRAGSLLSLRNADGKTALDLAVKYENYSAVLALREHYNKQKKPLRRPGAKD